jgi:putative endonuclease
VEQIEYINKMFIIYAIYNKNADKYYIGQTADIQKRLQEHNDHTFQTYTSRFQGTWELIYKESVATRSEALVREKQLKSFRGREFIRSHIPG